MQYMHLQFLPQAAKKKAGESPPPPPKIPSPSSSSSNPETTKPGPKSALTRSRLHHSTPIRLVPRKLHRMHARLPIPISHLPNWDEILGFWKAELHANFLYSKMHGWTIGDLPFLLTSLCCLAGGRARDDNILYLGGSHLGSGRVWYPYHFG